MSSFKKRHKKLQKMKRKQWLKLLMAEALHKPKKVQKHETKLLELELEDKHIREEEHKQC